MLVDIYADFQPGGSIDKRGEFQRILADCEAGKIDIIITKSVNRFGRNTLDSLNALNKLHVYGVKVFFESESIITSDRQNDFLFTLLQTTAQQENQDRSQNIRWGITRKVESGNSQLLKRKCYGYSLDEDGNLQIIDYEADVVRSIYTMYLQGYSIIGIVRELKGKNIKSPTGKDIWSKRTVDMILSNEKYTGDVIIFKTYNDGFPNIKRHKNLGEKDQYIARESNPAIISKEQFVRVQEEKKRRTNIIIEKDGIKRNPVKYSSRQSHDTQLENE
jgi:DNA invertase Pin-like site-specific DNA recombinase